MASVQAGGEPGQSAATSGADRVPIVEVVVTQEVDMWTASQLHARLEEALRLRPAQLIVDLAACPHLDAAGIGMFLQVHRQARQCGTQLSLRAPSPRLRRNLALARVDRVLTVTGSSAATPAPDEEPGEHA